MARRKKKSRTHVVKEVADSTIPKTFIVKTASVVDSSLVKDLRSVFEPNTAARLTERKSNKIKDFIAMAGPLGVSHLLVLTRTETQLNLRISKLSKGPTLHFKILRYSLARDVINSARKPHSPGHEFATAPILILNGFSTASADKQVALMATLFQNLFPAIKIHSMPLSQARRIVLITYDPTTKTCQFRHYLITVRPVGISRSVRRIIDGSSSKRASSVTSNYSARSSKSLPNLSSAKDISDYILKEQDADFTASEAESEYSSAGEGFSEDEGLGNTSKVTLPQKYVGRGNTKSEKRAVRLTELGPRLELGLVKIEDGIDGKGDVLFHEYIHKTAKEAQDLKKRAAQRESLRAQRRNEQNKNVAKKQAEKEAKKQAKLAKRSVGSSATDTVPTEAAEEENLSEEEEDEEEDEFAYEDLYGDDGELNEDVELQEPSDSDLSPEEYASEDEEEEAEEEELPPPKKPRTMKGSRQQKIVPGSKFKLKARSKR